MIALQFEIDKFLPILICLAYRFLVIPNHWRNPVNAVLVMDRVQNAQLTLQIR